jgi:hypothetical protein
MGCGCKQTKVVAPEPIPTIPTPEPPKGLTQEEMDWFNNIDVIKPIQDGRIEGQTE